MRESRVHLPNHIQVDSSQPTLLLAWDTGQFRENPETISKSSFRFDSERSFWETTSTCGYIWQQVNWIPSYCKTYFVSIYWPFAVIVICVIIWTTTFKLKRKKDSKYASNSYQRLTFPSFIQFTSLGAVQKCQRFPLMRSCLIRGGEGVCKNVEIS